MALMRGRLFAGALFAGVLFGPAARQAPAQAFAHVPRRRYPPPPFMRLPDDEDAVFLALLL